MNLRSASKGNRAKPRARSSLAWRVDSSLLRRQQQRELGGIPVPGDGVVAPDGVVAEHGSQMELAEIVSGSPDALHREPVLRQSAGLVRSHDRRAAKRLDRRQVPD